MEIIKHGGDDTELTHENKRIAKQRHWKNIKNILSQITSRQKFGYPLG
jgi:hypothetical protein